MEKLLIADKQGLIRTGLDHILKIQYPEAEIKSVGEGESLIHEVMSGQWNLVICDLYLPGFNGLRSIKKLKSSHPETSFLVLSIYSPELYAVRVFKAGASGYLHKEASAEELIKAVQRCLSGKKYISEAVAEKLLRRIDIEKEPHELLTNKELEVFKMVASGRSVTQISQYLSMALATASSYRTRIFHKLNMNSVAEITRYAISHHIISDLDFYSTN
jgi:DNA-binding NarL/FixJ family response regulator